MGVGYNTEGKEVDINDKECVAKEENGKYFVLYHVEYSMKKRMLEVHSIFFDKRDISTAGPNKGIQFKSVGKKAFDLYLKYLQNGKRSVYDLANDPFLGS